MENPHAADAGPGSAAWDRSAAGRPPQPSGLAWTAHPRRSPPRSIAGGNGRLVAIARVRRVAPPWLMRHCAIATSRHRVTGRAVLRAGAGADAAAGHGSRPAAARSSARGPFPAKRLGSGRPAAAAGASSCRRTARPRPLMPSRIAVPSGSRCMPRISSVPPMTIWCTRKRVGSTPVLASTSAAIALRRSPTSSGVRSTATPPTSGRDPHLHRRRRRAGIGQPGRFGLRDAGARSAPTSARRSSRRAWSSAPARQRRPPVC